MTLKLSKEAGCQPDPRKALPAWKAVSCTCATLAPSTYADTSGPVKLTARRCGLVLWNGCEQLPCARIAALLPTRVQTPCRLTCRQYADRAWDALKPAKVATRPHT